MTVTVEQLQAALAQDAKWGEGVLLLDLVNTVEEFEALAPTVEGSRLADLVDFYRSNLRRWADPQLSDELREKCPLLAERLDEPWKIRVFLRCADFRKVTPLIMGVVLEEMLHRHYVLGEKHLVYPYPRAYGQRFDALRFVYHTQLEAWTMKRLVLPDVRSCGISSETGLHVDWRSKEEKDADEAAAREAKARKFAPA